MAYEILVRSKQFKGDGVSRSRPKADDPFTKRRRGKTQTASFLLDDESDKPPAGSEKANAQTELVNEATGFTSPGVEGGTGTTQGSSSPVGRSAYDLTPEQIAREREYLQQQKIKEAQKEADRQEDKDVGDLDPVDNLAVEPPRDFEGNLIPPFIDRNNDGEPDGPDVIERYQPLTSIDPRLEEVSRKAAEEFIEELNRESNPVAAAAS